jgi:hypothetical protein
MIFSSPHFTMDQLSLGVNPEKSFAPLPPEQSVGIKAWVCTTEYHRSSKFQAKSTVTFAGGAFRN